MTPPAEQMRFSTANCGPNYVWPPRQRSRTYVSVNSMLQCNLSTRVVIRVPGISLLISSLSLTLPADGWMMNDAKNFRRCGGVKVFLLLLLQRDDAGPGLCVVISLFSGSVCNYYLYFYDARTRCSLAVNGSYYTLGIAQRTE